MKLKKQFFILLAAIIIFQFSFFGLKYFAVMDDNNQLGVFHFRSSNIYENVIKQYKSYNVRPLAFFSDAYVFSWFWDNMYALLLIMIIMHVANLFFIYKICEKIGVKLNAFSMVLFALCPILIEALYWISASTRIVFSLFLCLASIYLLLQSFDEENTSKKLVMFFSSIILNLVCVGYYEQTIALNLFLFTFVLICLKKYRYIFIPVVSTTWIGIWYIYFMINGKMQARGNLNLNGIFGKTIECTKMIYTNFKNAYSNFIYSLGFGKEVVLGTWISILFLILILGFIYYIYKNNCNKDENKCIFKKLIFSLIWIVVPFLPFVVLDTKFIAVRNLYFATLGFAVLIELVIDMILKLIKNNTACNIIKTAIIGFVMFFFVVSNIDGINNYKKVNYIDDKVVKQIIDNVDDEAFEEKKTISINYDSDELIKYKNLSNYVESVIESDWATMGKIQVMRNDINVGMVYINSKQDEADYTLYFDKNMELIK